jgi:hypothetical protein
MRDRHKARVLSAVYCGAKVPPAKRRRHMAHCRKCNLVRLDIFISFCFRIVLPTLEALQGPFDLPDEITPPEDIVPVHDTKGSRRDPNRHGRSAEGLQRLNKNKLNKGQTNK